VLVVAAVLAAVSCRESAPPPAAAAVVPAARVNVGDPAPDFSLPGSDGQTYRLADYKGKQAVVIAWFAKAFTGP
jgi:cytochrome oxidase Cu insertion factor (SCO1/SenC/PrrC family)